MNHSTRRFSRAALPAALLLTACLAPAAMARGVFGDPAAQFVAFGSASATLRNGDQNLNDSDLFPSQLVGPSHQDAINAGVTLDASGANLTSEALIDLSSTDDTVFFNLDSTVQSTIGTLPNGDSGFADAFARLAVRFFVPAGMTAAWSFSGFNSLTAQSEVSIILFSPGTRGPVPVYALEIDPDGNPSNDLGVLNPGEYIIESVLRTELIYSNQLSQTRQGGVSFAFNVTLIPTPGSAALLGLSGLIAARRRR